MIRKVLILANSSIYETNDRFDKSFGPLGEFVSELSHLYTILKERSVELILIPDVFPGINQGIIRRLRMRSPMADIWEIVQLQGAHLSEDGVYDGTINLGDGPEQISKMVRRILHQKELLKKFKIVGRSERMKVVAETIERIAPTDISVMVIGPSGSGKELVARAIHDNSSRKTGRFVAVNCGALAEGVLESELFGHEKGAFTGSVAKREGLFVRADGGTIFLDEIGETKPDMQVKLLRVLEDGVFYPVGSDKPVRSDARVITATNRDLSEAIRDGIFREDLYFRLGIVKISLPPLHERKEDVLPLLCHFAATEGCKGYSDGAMEILQKYDWPGNVRQLRNFVAGMSALHPDGEVSAREVEQFIAEQAIEQRNLPIVTGHTPEEAGHELIYHALLSLGNDIKLLRDLITSNLPESRDIEGEHPIKSETESLAGKSLQDMERVMIESVLRETAGNRKAAADILGIGERTLYRKLKQYNLS